MSRPPIPPEGVTRRGVLLALPALALWPGPVTGTVPSAPMPPATVPRRVPPARGARSIHSGHSLTDAYVHLGPFPGHLRRIAEAIGEPNPFRDIVKSTIPGSPMRWRWQNRVEDQRPNYPSADARHDIGDFDTLVITEAGPPARPGLASEAEGLRDSLDYLCRFAANALRHGRGGQGLRDIALWSIWPAHTLWRPDPPPAARAWAQLPDLATALAAYDESHRYLADHASHILRRTHPDLPPDWRIWVFPGHLFLARLSQDLAHGGVPGATALSEFFADGIHPTPVLGFGLSCLMASCLYQTDLRGHELPDADGVSPELRTYFADISWQIASEYAPAGLGGQEAAQPLWQAGRDPDLLPGWTPSEAQL